MSRETIKLAPCRPGEEAQAFTQALDGALPGELLLYHVGFTCEVPTRLKAAVGLASDQGLCFLSQRPTTSSEHVGERTFHYLATKAHPKRSSKRSRR